MHGKKWNAALAGIAFVWVSAVATALPDETKLISMRDQSFALLSASGESTRPTVSADGHFVAFESLAGNLVAGDTNRRSDIFVLDRENGELERVSVGVAGAQANNDSSVPLISADGRYVVFGSAASNLVPNDTNAGYDVFLHDRQTRLTIRISLSSSGEEAAHTVDPDSPVQSAPLALSGNGRYVVFASNADNFAAGSTAAPNQLYVRDLVNGLTTAVSVDSSGALANDLNAEAAISADGRYVAFSSSASNLVPNDTNLTYDIFVRDREAGTTSRVSVNSGGEEAGGVDFPASFRPSLSADGQLVTFQSDASNLVSGDDNASTDIFVRDLANATTALVSTGADGTPANSSSSSAALSADGRYVLFQSGASNLVVDDTNEQMDLFVRDLTVATTTRVNVAENKAEPNASSSDGAISADGEYIAYSSSASNIVNGDHNDRSDVFVRARARPKTLLVSAARLISQTASGGSGVARDRALSANGRFVAFHSNASILVDDDTNQNTDVFLRDTEAALTTLISRGVAGEPANSSSSGAAISATGRYVAYQSFAGNLVPGDTNENFDIFLYDRRMTSTSRVNLGANGQQAGPFDASSSPSVSSDGRYVAFESDALLVPDDSEFTPDVFIRDRQASLTSRANVAGHPALSPSISAIGQYIAYAEQGDIYVLDQATGARRLVSVSSTGVRADNASSDPSISADGRFIAFTSLATNLVPGVAVDDLAKIYVRDRVLGTTSIVSVDSTGAPANADSFEPVISGNGRYVAFYSTADNLVANPANHFFQIFVHDRLSGVTTLESVDSNGVPGNGDSLLPSLDFTGHKVVFTSQASNLTPGDFNEDADVFEHEHRDASVIRLNVGGGGFTDAAGHFWQYDHGYNTGSVSTFTSPIANTDNDALYQSERWDSKAEPELQYSFNVANGTYLVRLHFAENYPPNFGRTRRVFDVDMEGAKAFTHVDIFAEVGARAALVKSATVSVTDGQLNILFRHLVQNPLVDAIEIIGQ